MSVCSLLSGLGAALALAASATVFGCGAPPPTPEEVVELYFRSLGRDPSRSLPILTDTFHERHGLSVPRLEGFSWGLPGTLAPLDPPDDHPLVRLSKRERGVESAQTAWIMVQSQRAYRQTAVALHTLVESVETSGDEARVDVRVDVAGAARPLMQHFLLLRSPAGEWRIDWITQSRVVRETVMLAYVAYPSEQMRLAVMASTEQ